MAAKATRKKLSTTVASETYAFLQRLAEKRGATTIGEALDRAVAVVLRLQNRRRLANATSQYYEQLDMTAVEEERSLSKDLSRLGEV